MCGSSSSGQLVFPQPVAITDLVEHDDGTRWAFVEGSSSAVSVDELTPASPMDDFVNPDKSGGAGSADARNGIEDGPLVRFTAFASNRRLSKHYKRKPDGDLETLSGTQFSSGGYYVCEIPAAGVTGPSILATVGQVIDKLSSKQAIGLGVPLNGTITGTIVTKAQHAKGNITAIPRSLDYFGWPGLGLLLLDGDDIEGLPEILSELYPPFKEVAVLTRPSASASVINPKTKQKLKAGEHCYVVIDDPSLSDACLKALMRLAWVRGKDKGAGRLMLSKRGDALVRGPIDACVGSPERLSYEGQAVIDDGISRLPRVSKVVGGTGMLCARDLVAFANQHAPEDQYHALVDEAKADPEFCKRRDAAKVAYRGEHVAKAVKRGIPREKAEKAYDESIAAGSATIGERTWLPLADEHVLYTPDGDAFTVADIKKDPLKYHDNECADPIEGMDYQSKNCAIIYTNGEQIEIYSRAHGDAFAYVAPLDDEDWATLFARITGVQTFESITSPAFSEDAIALEFTERHRDEVRYTAQWGKWHLWDGQRWAEDRKRKVFNMARAVCREVAVGMKGDSKKTIASNKTKMGVLGLAMDDQRTAAVAEQWDADIWKLCTPGGMVDLKTGKIRPALPDDYCTMMTAAKPGGPCPLWMDFLNTVTAGDKELIRFLQVCCGYALTGSTREQILLFLWGRGGNGKSVFIETITGVMGDYHTGAAMDTFVETKERAGAASDRHGGAARRPAGDGGGDRAGPALGRIEDQDDDRQRQDHGAVHAAGLLQLRAAVHADDLRQLQAGIEVGRRGDPAADEADPVHGDDCEGRSATRI